MKIFNLIILLISIIWVGDPERAGTSSVNFLTIPQTTGIDAFNSIGFSNLNVSSIAEISHANPVSLNQFSKPQLGFFLIIHLHKKFFTHMS
jgi:hypothetical protein